MILDVVFNITFSARQPGIVFKKGAIFRTQTLHYFSTVWVQVTIWKYSRPFVTKIIETNIGHVYGESIRFSAGDITSLRGIQMVLDDRIEKCSQSGEAD